jgi:hypothetical protein
LFVGLETSRKKRLCGFYELFDFLLIHPFILPLKNALSLFFPVVTIRRGDSLKMSSALRAASSTIRSGVKALRCTCAGTYQCSVLT